MRSGQAGGTFSRGGSRPAGGAPGLPFTAMLVNGRGLRKTKPSPSPSPLFSFRGGAGKAAAPEPREVGGGGLQASRRWPRCLGSPPKAVVTGGSSWKVGSSLEGPAGALWGWPGLLCKAGKASQGQLRILTPGCKAASVARSDPGGAACLMVPLPCRNANQDTRPAGSNPMQRPQLGPNVSLPLEMGPGHLAAR